LNYQGKLGEKSRAGLERTSRTTATLELQQGGRFEIEDVSTIGRAPDCSIVLNERSVSRHHARIFFESAHYWIKDLDSANGIKLNGKKISFQMLGDNDKIAFGEVEAIFHTSGTVTGPARIGSDPLEGSDFAFQDGTPTGGFTATAAAEFADAESPQMRPRSDVMRERPLIKEENKKPLPASSMSDSSSTLEQENERLKKLVKQLERALADSNLRIRNLQELLDRRKD
jgi:predicted component of type VI protein secretion system